MNEPRPQRLWRRPATELSPLASGFSAGTGSSGREGVSSAAPGPGLALAAVSFGARLLSLLRRERCPFRRGNDTFRLAFGSHVVRWKRWFRHGDRITGRQSKASRCRRRRLLSPGLRSSLDRLINAADGRLRPNKTHALVRCQVKVETAKVVGDVVALMYFHGVFRVRARRPGCFKPVVATNVVRRREFLLDAFEV